MVGVIIVIIEGAPQPAPHNLVLQAQDIGLEHADMELMTLIRTTSLP